MPTWLRSSVVEKELDDFVATGLLRPQTDEMDWLVPGAKDKTSPPPGYVVSFVPFHERGVTTPAHDFFRALLHHYDAALQHLNPNGIQHISAYVALCESFLGIEPHFRLWCPLFSAVLRRHRVPRRLSARRHRFRGDLAKWAARA